MSIRSGQDVPKIADDFVKDYFNMLLNSPAEAHKFYGKGSKFARPEEDGSTSTTTTLKCISNKILSLNYGQFRVEIKSVNAQESVNSGILVLVTGLLIGNANIIRSFTQVLHLVQLKKRFYVLNDILQYVDNASSHYGKKDSTSDMEKIISTTNKERVVKPTKKIEGKRKKQKFVELRGFKQKVVKPTKKIEGKRKKQKKFKTVLTKKPSASTSGGRSLKEGRPIGLPNEQLLELGSELRGTASKEWNLVNSYTQKLESTACTSEERRDAFQKILSHEKAAQEASRNASKIIFTASSNVFKNKITIDLHGQHVKEAMWIFKRHLKYCTLLRSVQFLIVITGYGSHTGGISKIKPSVIDLLMGENVEWKEMENNKGALKITIDKDKEFSFFKSDWASS